MVQKARFMLGAVGLREHDSAKNVTFDQYKGTSHFYCP